jgi:hypothetical protein
MSDQWFYARGGQQAGPVSFTELVALAQTGGLTPGDLVWQDGTPDWRAAGQVAGLFPTGAPAAAPAPMQQAYAPPQQYQPYPPQGMAYGNPAGQGYYGAPVGQSYANDARTAMIVAIIGIFCFGIVLGPIGLVLGNSAKKKMRASGNMEGEGMANAAIIIGWIIVGLAIVGILFFILAAAMSAGSR